MRHLGFQRISENLETLHDLWDDILEKDKGLNSDVKGRIIGVNASSRTFDFLFFIELGLLIYGQTDALSQTLQAERMTLLCGKELCASTRTTLLGDRTEERFKLFYDKVMKRAGKCDNIGNPKLPHRKKNMHNFFTPSARLTLRVAHR